MEFRRVGDSGLQVSLLGLGCNNFGRRLDRQATQRVVHAALDAGITLFDTADVYSNGESEEYLGAALGERREQAVIATKFRSPMGDGPYNQGGSRRYVTRAVEQSLRRLATDHIDLYQMHGPDNQVPLEETLATLDDLVKAGKVRYIGCSNFSGWQIADGDWIARTGHLSHFISAQNHYSLLERGVEREVIPACLHFGLGVIPYFPLASGMLTGKYKRDSPPPQGTRLGASPSPGRFLNDDNFDVVEKLEDFARERGTTLLSLAIAGLAAQPAVCSVIAGATKAEQIEANTKAVDWVPTTKDLDAINEIAPSLAPRR